MPWTFPLGLVSGRLRSPWASIQSTPPGPVRTRETAERAERNRVVAAEHERKPARRARLGDDVGDPRAGLQDLLQVAHALVADRGRLRLRRSGRCPGRCTCGRAARSARRDPRSGSPTGPCRRRGARRRGRARRRSPRPAGGSRRWSPVGRYLAGVTEWRGPESNRRHHGFQPCALPTELPRPAARKCSQPKNEDARDQRTRTVSSCPGPIVSIPAALPPVIATAMFS